MANTASKHLMRPQELYSQLNQPRHPRSLFDHRHSWQGTFDAGYLIPISVQEVLPADTWSGHYRAFCRINTLIRPLMDNLYMDIHTFFVPNRIIMRDWVVLMGEQADPDNPVTVTAPQFYLDNTVNTDAIGYQTLADYMGLPCGVKPSAQEDFTQLPFRAYQKIFDDFYRDENLQKKILTNAIIDSNADIAYKDVLTSGLTSLRKRNKRKDYFTSALPWPQKGTAPTMTLGSSAPVTGTITVNGTNLQSALKVTGGQISNFQLNTSNQVIFGGSAPAAISDLQAVHNSGNHSATHSLTADLSNSIGFTLNAFREFAIVQQYLELDARTGTRYVEHLYSFFGVQPEDSRLQRAEYIHGQSLPLMVTPIAQTAETLSGTPQGNLAGMGTFSNAGDRHPPRFVKSFTEDGWLITLASVRQELKYQSGLERKWKRQARFDYYRPIFANLGEQAIRNDELHFTTNSTTNALTFGYQQAWSELRYSTSKVVGLLRSSYSLTLDSWGLWQKFTSTPTLTTPFIEENPPMDRVVAVPTEPDFVGEFELAFSAARAMPMLPIPGLTKL